jgi:hypothetical protein
MRASILCFVIASVLIAVYAQNTPRNPNIPKQFTCDNCTYTFSYAGSKYSTEGQWWYDANANMMRQDYVDQHGEHLEFLQAVGRTGSGYVCWIYADLNPPSCATQDIWGPISVDLFGSFNAGNGATFVGNEVVNGTPCDRWSVVGELETYDLWVQSSNVANPIQFREISFKGDYIITDFNDFIPGQPAAGTFNIPSYCKTN